MTKAKRKMVVMHPLPRIDEIRSVTIYRLIIIINHYFNLYQFSRASLLRIYINWIIFTDVSSSHLYSGPDVIKYLHVFAARDSTAIQEPHILDKQNLEYTSEWLF